MIPLVMRRWTACDRAPRGPNETSLQVQVSRQRPRRTTSSTSGDWRRDAPCRAPVPSHGIHANALPPPQPVSSGPLQTRSSTDPDMMPAADGTAARPALEPARQSGLSARRPTGGSAPRRRGPCDLALHPGSPYAIGFSRSASTPMTHNGGGIRSCRAAAERRNEAALAAECFACRAACPRRPAPRAHSIFIVPSRASGQTG